MSLNAAQESAPFVAGSSVSMACTGMAHPAVNCCLHSPWEEMLRTAGGDERVSIGVHGC